KTSPSFATTSTPSSSRPPTGNIPTRRCWSRAWAFLTTHTIRRATPPITWNCIRCWILFCRRATGARATVSRAPAGDERGMSSSSRVRPGLAVIRDQLFAPCRGLRIGLVTHAAAVDEHLRPAVDLFAQAPGVQLAALFGPEHGFQGDAQDLIRVGHDRDP